MRLKPRKHGRKHFAVMVYALAFVVSSSIACSREELPRRTALDRINRSAQFRLEKPEIPLTAVQFECGMRAGLWGKVTGDSLQKAVIGEQYVLTTRGKAVFASISKDYSSSAVATVQLSGGYHRTAVEVTGITDSEIWGYDGKEIQFDWDWEWIGSSEQAAACITPSKRKSTALFRRYDHGWLVERII
ncbi:MAG TPA: hypothetical protein VF311_04485 [Terriglobales bacterium]